MRDGLKIRPGYIDPTSDKDHDAILDYYVQDILRRTMMLTR
jgi:hypothetical protein